LRFFGIQFILTVKIFEPQIRDTRKLSMKKSIIELTEEYVLDIFKHDLPPNLYYHDLNHTMSVRQTALILGEHYDIGASNLEAMELAALLHDTGYVEAYVGHEAVSAKLAESFLSNHNYPTERITLVKELIDATKLVYEPKNLLQRIIKDSDLNNLGQKKYMKTIANLRHETKIFLGTNYTDAEFMEMNLRFMDGHSYFTEKASDLFDGRKAKNRKKVVQAWKDATKPKEEEKINKKEKVKVNKPKKHRPPLDTINGNKSAQMMFKTALRNHIDLTSIADNKANIMLSINALIITISLPLLASSIAEDARMVFPTSILLTTCVASIIYATLATRPIKTKGLTSINNIESGPTNLFFYGNFFRMNFKDYKKGVKLIIEDDSKLDDSIMSDLFYLGKALGNKFNKLRMCYLIFMVGTTLTVLAFGLLFFLTH